MIVLAGFGGGAPAQPAPIIIQQPSRSDVAPTRDDPSTSKQIEAATDAKRAETRNTSGRAGSILTSREGIPTIERPTGEVNIRRPKARQGLLDEDEDILVTSMLGGTKKKKAA